MSKDTENSPAVIDAETEDVTATENNNDSTSVEAEKTSSGSKLIIFVVILVILCLGGIAYLAYAGMQFKQSVESQLVDVQSSFEKANQDVRGRQSADTDRIQALQSQLNGFDRLLEEGSAQQKELLKAVEQLRAVKPDSNLQWGLMEAEYLLVIAMHRLQLEHDVKTAIAAVETADKRLQGLSDPGLIPVRRQLTQDLNALKSVNLVDISGPALYLADLVARVESLPLEMQDVETRSPRTEATSTNTVDVPDNWDKALQLLKDIPALIWRELKSLVVIKKSSGGKTAFILPEEEYFIYQNLKIELNNARLSVLLRDEKNLHASIDLIQQWLEAHFVMDHSAVSNLDESLEKMRSLKLQQAVPDISSSLETLKAYSRTRKARSPSAG